MIDQDWIEQISRALTEACPMTANNEEALLDVKRQIHEHIAATNRLPSELEVITNFAVPHEQRLIRESQSKDIAARKKTRLDYLSGEGATREDVARELSERRTPEPVRKAYVPDREYTQSEIDKMGDDEAKRVLFGQESLGLNKESSKLNVEKPANELDEYHRNKILNYRGTDPIMRGLKRQLLDGAEQKDVEYRRRVIESRENERRKVQEELRKAGKR